MKDWLVCPIPGGDYWLTRIEISPAGREHYLCGCCDGPLEDSVVGLYQSSRGAPGLVASSVCWKCHILLGDDDLPAGEFDAQIELLLAKAVTA